MDNQPIPPPQPPPPPPPPMMPSPPPPMMQPPPPPYGGAQYAQWPQDTVLVNTQCPAPPVIQRAPPPPENLVCACIASTCGCLLCPCFGVCALYHMYMADKWKGQGDVEATKKSKRFALYFAFTAITLGLIYYITDIIICTSPSLKDFREENEWNCWLYSAETSPTTTTTNTTI